MTTVPSHNRPFFLELPSDTRVGAGFQHVLEADAIRHYAIPAPWQFERAGVHLASWLPKEKTLRAGMLPDALEDLVRICDGALLEQLVQRTWTACSEHVRDHYLQRGTLSTVASIFGFSKKSRAIDPPPAFTTDRIQEFGFQVEYRLAEEEGDFATAGAPMHEGTIACYPFEIEGRTALAEAGLEPGGGPLLEIFAYGPARDRHRGVFEQIAAAQGWRVRDPDAD